MKIVNGRKALGILSVLLYSRSFAQTNNLLKGFSVPPDSIKPSVYWYWMNNNISVNGVEKDIAAMSEVGIGRAFIGNVGFGNHGMGLESGPDTLFSDGWWKTTEAAIRAGGSHGVDIGLFNGPGWSQSGGPWIKPTDAMRYLSGDEISVTGPSVFSRQLKDFSPPVQTDGSEDAQAALRERARLFQEVGVLAFPTPASDEDQAGRHGLHITSNTDSFNVEAAVDGNWRTSALLPPAVNSQSVVNIDWTATDPFTTRSLSLYPAHNGMSAHMELQAYEQGAYRTIKTFVFDRSNPALNVGFIPWGPVVVSFPAVTADKYRLVLSDIHGRGGFTEISLSAAARTERYIEKQLGKMYQAPLPMWNEYQWPAQAAVPDTQALIRRASVIDLSAQISADGRLTWNVPPGKWTIVRMGMLPTGVTNSPATQEGTGYDVDKLNKQAIEYHFQSYIGKVLAHMPAAERKAFKFVVADSYETGSQNWTEGFGNAFRQRYHYDPLPWLPVFGGRVVESPDKSDRFLWDVRRLVADKVAYDYVGGLRRISHLNGLKLWLENYGHWGFPSEFLLYGSQSDEVAGEFWAEGDLGSIECRDASSAAHIYGKKLVSAESFTSAGNDYGRYPGLLKKRGDWSFTEGINNTLFHLYIQQTDDRRPGIGAWFGTEFNRNNTWFRQGKAFIDYIRRCNFMLRQGLAVDDVAYFIGEDVPKMTGIRDPDLPAGYQFDYVNADVIQRRMSVRNGRLMLPDGMSYRLLVLPKMETMRPELLRRIVRLVDEGATVMGTPPQRSPSLEGGAAADRKVAALAAALWGPIKAGQRKLIRHGKGTVITGMTMAEAMDLLKTPPDFTSRTTSPILYIHRSVNGQEMYFITNQSDSVVRFTPSFRTTVGNPVWCDPVTGESRPLADFHRYAAHTDVPIVLEGSQSGFVLFEPVAHDRPAASGIPKAGENFPAPILLKILSAPWNVVFDTAMRGPATPVLFDTLEDWSKSQSDSIRNYSGTAVYSTIFDMTELPAGKDVYLYLGKVKVMATVTLNGHPLGTAWTAPWRVKATTALIRGKNRLEITVVNTWINRLIGDSRLPLKDRLTWSNMNNYHPDSAYDPSGLMGPVTLQAAPR